MPPDTERSPGPDLCPACCSMKEAILLSLAQRLEEIGSRGGGVARIIVIIVISDLAGPQTRQT